MKLSIRMDDITPDMDMEKFRRFQKMLEKYGVAPLLGVVPDNKDPGLSCQEKDMDFYAMLRQLEKQGYSIALHGFQHVYTTAKRGLFPLNGFSEFAGIPLEKQEVMIREGKELLEKEGIKVEIFMAPGHSYDGNTLKALKKCGIHKLTDGFGNRPYNYKGVVFYPISFIRNRSLKKENGFTTLVVHTNTMTDRDFEEFEKMLELHRKNFINYSEYLAQPPIKRTLLGHGWEYGMAIVKAMLVQIKSHRV